MTPRIHVHQFVCKAYQPRNIWPIVALSPIVLICSVLSWLMYAFCHNFHKTSTIVTKFGT